MNAIWKRVPAATRGNTLITWLSAVRFLYAGLEQQSRRLL